MEKCIQHVFFIQGVSTKRDEIDNFSIQGMSYNSLILNSIIAFSDSNEHSRYFHVRCLIQRGHRKLNKVLFRHLVIKFITSHQIKVQRVKNVKRDPHNSMHEAEIVPRKIARSVKANITTIINSWKSCSEKESTGFGRS